MKRLFSIGLVAGLLLGGCGGAKSPPLDVVLVGRVADARWQQIQHGAGAAAESVEWAVECWAPPHEDAQAQIKQIDGYLERGIRGLALAPSSPKALAGTIQKALDKGVPVITVDRDAPKSLRLAFVGASDKALGYQAGRAMVAALTGERGAHGNVIIIAHSVKGREAQQRLEGFRDVMRVEPGVAVVETIEDEGDAEVARSAALSAMMRRRDLAGFYAVQPGSALQCAAAVEQLGRAGQVRIVCIGATSDIMRRVGDGTITAAVAPRLYLTGKRAVELLWTIVTKGPERALSRLPENRALDPGSDLVTRRDLFLRRREFERVGLPVDF